MVKRGENVVTEVTYKKEKNKMTKRVGVYARVSTDLQTSIQQQEILKEYCHRAGYEVVDIYVDEGVSSMKSNRPQFLRILDDARKRKIDLILTYRIDRFSRSVRELLNTMQLLNEYGCGFMSYSNREMDTTTSSGKFLFQILASVSELERSIISERTKLKLNYIRSKGKILGRPIKADYQTVYVLRDKGLSLSKIGKATGIVSSTVSKILKKRAVALMKPIVAVSQSSN